MAATSPSSDHSRLISQFRRALTPLEEFIHQESSSGILLMACGLVAIVLANSPLSAAYEHLLHTKVTVGGGYLSLSQSLHHWINDGLMVLFFFVVGLEVKREILIGELSHLRQAILPISAAMGGMLIPALGYLLLNHEGVASQGWGIPMATDIAFALGVLALLGNRIPKPLVALLLSLAIVDDLGAVLIIALFYTDSLNLGALAAAGGCLGLLVLLNLAGVRRPLPYFLLGVLMWLAMLKSGVHATLAGVLTALTVPARSSVDAHQFTERMRVLVSRFHAQITPDRSSAELNILRNANKQQILQEIENTVQTMESPLQRLLHTLHPWVSFLVVPIFALANAGVTLDFSNLATLLGQPVTLGVMVGLVLGKCFGIFLFSWSVVTAGLCRLPEGVTFEQVLGVSLLAGIGFTMSIFIGGLAFADHPELLQHAKTGIVFASLIAGAGGYLLLRLTTGKTPA